MAKTHDFADREDDPVLLLIEQLSLSHASI